MLLESPVIEVCPVPCCMILKVVPVGISMVSAVNRPTEFVILKFISIVLPIKLFDTLKGVETEFSRTDS